MAEAPPVLSNNTNKLKTLTPPWLGRKHRHPSADLLSMLKGPSFGTGRGQGKDGSAPAKDLRSSATGRCSSVTPRRVGSLPAQVFLQEGSWHGRSHWLRCRGDGTTGAHNVESRTDIRYAGLFRERPSVPDYRQRRGSLGLVEVMGLNLNRWLERVYSENDTGRVVATSLAGATGLTTYLYWDDWVVAGFSAIITFPIVRLSASALHSRWNRLRERDRSRGQLKDLLDSLGSEEKAVVQAFVWHGGSVITWGQCNQSPHFSAAGIESLINRDLMHASVTADGMTETFVLDTQLFDYAQTVLPNEPF